MKAAQGSQPRHSHQIKDWAAFRAFAVVYGDKTQAEMVQHWSGGVSQRTIARALTQVNWTRKKNTYDYRERDAARQVTFQAQLAAIPSFQRVYVDEAGMDERDDYGYGSASGVRSLRHCGRGAEPDGST